MHCMMPDYAREMAKKGFDFVTLGNDVRMLSAELAARVGAFRGSAPERSLLMRRGHLSSALR